MYIQLKPPNRIQVSTIHILMIILQPKNLAFEKFKPYKTPYGFLRAVFKLVDEHLQQCIKLCCVIATQTSQGKHFLLLFPGTMVNYTHHEKESKYVRLLITFYVMRKRSLTCYETISDSAESNTLLNEAHFIFRENRTTDAISRFYPRFF